MIAKKINKVSGLYYIANFIDNHEQLLNDIDSHEWLPLTTSINSRKVQQYGYIYDYKYYNSKKKGLEMFNSLIDIKNNITDLCKELKLINDDYEFNQCIINDYLPGQGISKHIDHKSFGDVICCLTINSGATMRFIKDGIIYNKYVEPNSLYIMSGEARYNWTHEMTITKIDIVNNVKINRDRRISVTFRNVK